MLIRFESVDGGDSVEGLKIAASYQMAKWLNRQIAT